MNVDVTVNSQSWKVALEPAEQAGTFTVTIKGVSRVIDASWIDADTLSLLDGGSGYEVRFHRRDDNSAVGVEIGGILHEVVVAKRGREPAPFSEAAGRHAVKSPMPGRIVRVLVAVGDHVTARQGVVVVEAMKMENELRTPTHGVVKEVLVVPGAAVETGAVLVVVDQ